MLTHFAITQRGESHRKAQCPCQDASLSRCIPAANGTVYAAAVISDGVGSCEYSQLGAQTVTKTVMGQIEKTLHNADFQISDHNLQVLLRYAFNAALWQVARQAERRKLPLDQLDCTATAVIFDGEQAVFGHIGDGGIVVVFDSGAVRMITKRHKGKYAESVYPLEMRSHWQFGSYNGVVSLALMTDGLLDFAVDGEGLDNRVYFPFLQPILAVPLVSDKEARACRKAWYSYLAQPSTNPNSLRKKVRDDMTLVVLQAPQRVKALEGKVLFDQQQWERQSQEYKQRQEEILYANRREGQKRMKGKGMQPD